jgi:hypothetical protein
MRAVAVRLLYLIVLRGRGIGGNQLPGRLQHLDRTARDAPPAWAARDAMLADGILDEDGLHRWEAALARLDSAPVRPTIFAPQFTAIGRRSA